MTAFVLGPSESESNATNKGIIVFIGGSLEKIAPRCRDQKQMCRTGQLESVQSRDDCRFRFPKPYFLLPTQSFLSDPSDGLIADDF